MYGMIKYLFLLSLPLSFSGTCPSCPRTVQVGCFCGRSKPLVKRCGSLGWSCGRVCGRVLSCQLHTCERHCHNGGLRLMFTCTLLSLLCSLVILSLFVYYNNFHWLGECGNCVEVIEQPCRCGKLTQERPCSYPEWSCETVSNTFLSVM